jgi:NAD(P)H-hydrate epimerase
MRKVEEVAAQSGVTASVLLGRAAERLVELGEKIAGPLRDKRVVVLAGPTWSGARGAAAARLWHERGAKGVLVLARKEKEYGGTAGEQVAHAEKSGAKVLEGFQEKIFDEAALVVDALIGSALSGPPLGSYSLLIKAANFSLKPVLAIDVPSGLDPNSGTAPGPCMRAQATLAFGMPMKGLLASASEKATGALWLADVGISREMFVRAGVPAGSPFKDGPLLRLR